jgi:RimJ/RimL family protein N-acetyltransferase
MTGSARIDIAATLAGLPAFPQLQGKRVRLRGPRKDDAEALFALFSDPAVMRYWSRPPMTTLGEAQGLLGEMLDSFEQRSLLNWMVTTRDDDGVIGTCTLFRIDPRHRHAEIGYALRSDHWGRGLACEAVTLMLDWAFRRLDLQRVEADIDPHNDGSRQLLGRLGFSSEGVMRQRFFVGDVATDSEIFGLLAADWHNHSL